MPRALARAGVGAGDRMGSVQPKGLAALKRSGSQRDTAVAERRWAGSECGGGEATQQRLVAAQRFKMWTNPQPWPAPGDLLGSQRPRHRGCTRLAARKPVVARGLDQASGVPCGQRMRQSRRRQHRLLCCLLLSALVLCSCLFAAAAGPH